MSKKTIMMMSAVFLFAGVLIGAIYNVFMSKHYDKQECSMSLVVFHKNARANITLNYMYSLKNQNGIVAVSGTYIEDNKLKGRIRRDVAYNWTENQDSYHLHSTRINKFEIIETLPDDLLADILPDFYVYPDKDVSYSILNQGVHGFLFTIGKRPLLYCAR
ncbi:hypothetical protein JYK13_03215 [Citrobacter sp. ku-bf4]|uniref:hypothetical protein n=1 Tax=Citrobacter TaxID=544 RepID=UPI00197E47D0|nr:hypothetical protein [Citrobacter amalonaticus]MBN6042983.1 hypothetical protein [Citrobacter sp. ku-bf4]MBS0824359.1 hypothetical protein [Citrobacter amalonaticus]